MSSFEVDARTFCAGEQSAPCLDCSFSLALALQFARGACGAALSSRSAAVWPAARSAARAAMPTTCGPRRSCGPSPLRSPQPAPLSCLPSRSDYRGPNCFCLSCFSSRASRRPQSTANKAHQLKAGCSAVLQAAANGTQLQSAVAREAQNGAAAPHQRRAGPPQRPRGCLRNGVSSRSRRTQQRRPRSSGQRGFVASMDLMWLQMRWFNDEQMQCWSYGLAQRAHFGSLNLSRLLALHRFCGW